MRLNTVSLLYTALITLWSLFTRNFSHARKWAGLHIGRKWTPKVWRSKPHYFICRFGNIFSLHLQDEQYQTPDRTASVIKPHCIKWSLIRWTTSHPTALLQLENHTASNGQVNIITFFVVSLHFSFNTSLHFISFFLSFCLEFSILNWPFSIGQKNALHSLNITMLHRVLQSNEFL